jgi:DnaJ-class molecular chaperone
MMPAMPTTRDYYEVLGVSRTATDKEIKAAYRRLARKHHPDVNRGDAKAEDRFKEVAAAFAVLSDPEKRARYDKGGAEAFGPGFDPFAGADFGSFDFGSGDLGDLFRMFQGGGSARRGQRTRAGADLQAELRIPFITAIQGDTVEVSVPRGARSQPERVRVRIPAGIEDGARLRVAGQGRAAAGGGSSGDLYLVIHVEPHATLRREGRDLIGEAAIGIVRAAMGGEIQVPTVDGTATITIPPGTASGQKFRLRGRGVPAAGGRPAGDLYAVIQIRPPRQLDEKSRELLEEFARLNPEG